MFKNAPVLLALAACGPAVVAPADDLPAIDESVCARGQLEEDGVPSGELKPLAAGSYVISTTYLRLPLTKSAVKRFGELNAPIEDALRRNGGVVQVVTRLSTACNTARTFAIWKDEAAMYALVTSPEHSAAIAAIGEVSRGGSTVTHWVDDGSGASWAEAARRLAADTGPFY